MQEKKALREEKLKQEEKYMWAIVDGVKEKVWFCLALAFSFHTWYFKRNYVVLSSKFIPMGL